MKLKFILLLFLIVFSGNIFSQENLSLSDQNSSERYLKTYGKIDLGFSGLGLSLETPLSDKILFEIAAGVGAGYRIDEDFRYRFYFDNPAAFVTVHGKYYYNQEDRVSKGRPVSYNAGNFFGVKIKYASPTLREKKTWNTLLTGFHWGLQRRMGKHFVYQLDIGIGAAIDIDSKTTAKVTLFPDFNFRVSYVLPFHK